MSLVLVFDSAGIADKEISKRKRGYNKFNDEIGRRYKVKDQEYRQSTSYNEKSLESQKSRYKKEFGEDTDISCFLINPELIGIPQEVRIEILKGLGKDLSLTVCFELESHRPEYTFGLSIDPRDSIVGYHDRYASMQYLVDGLMSKIAEVSNAQYGASITPVFYTVREDTKLTQNEADGMKNFLTQFLEMNPEEIPEQELNEGKSQISSLDFTEPINTGLSDEEIAEFEKYYLEK